MDFNLYCFYDFNGCYIFYREILRLAKPPILQCLPCFGWQLHVAFIAMVMKLYLVVYDMLIILYTLDFCKWNYSTIFYWVMRIMMFVLEFRILELLWIFCYRDGHSYIEHSKHKLRSFCWSRYPLKLTTNLNKTKWSHKFMIHHDEVIF